MIYLLSLVAIFLVILFYKNTVPAIDTKKRILLITLRSISLIIVLLLLLNPILYLLRTEHNKPAIIILNDVSESMTSSVNDTTKTERIELFKTKIPELYSDNYYSLKNYNFASSLEGESDNTLLVKALEEVLEKNRNTNIAGIFLLSDGWFHDEKLDFLNNIDLPITTFDPQFSSTEFDLMIRDVNFNKTFFTEEINPFVLDLSAENYSAKANLQFFIENKLQKSLEVDFSEGQFQQVVIEHEFSFPGLFPVEFKLSIENEEENNTANNVYPAAVNVLKERSGILIISDKLGWDIKFIKDAISKNERWGYNYLQKNDVLKFKQQEVALIDQMDNTDVLILVNYGNLTFSTSEKELIRNHLVRGGGLLVQGKVIKSLEDILPATDAGINREFTATLFFTETSRKYESFNFAQSEISQEIPPLRYHYCNPKLQSEILAGFNNEDRSAAIVYSQLEKGRILYLAFYDLWKWQLRDPENNFQTFITDVCSWLAMGNTERFISFTDKNSYFTGENVRIDLQAYDEKLEPLTGLNAKLILSVSSGKTILEKYLDSSETGYFTYINELPAEKYRFQILDETRQLETSGEFIISEINAEKRDAGFNTPLLSYISETTGGKMYKLDDLENLQVSTSETQTFTRKIEIPIYKKWYLITLFIILFCIEIYLRKRWGLL